MSEREQNINEQLKAKIDDLDLDTKIAQVKEQAEKAFQQVKEQAGTLLHDNREKVDELIEKATSVIDEKTEGKYHDKVSKAKASFTSGLDKLEQSRANASDADSTYARPTHEGTEGHVGHETEAVATQAVAPEAVAPTVEEPASPPSDPTAWSTQTDKL